VAEPSRRAGALETAHDRTREHKGPAVTKKPSKAAVSDKAWDMHYEARYQQRSESARRRRNGRQKTPKTKPHLDTALRDAAYARLKARHAAEVLTRKPDAPWWPYVALMRHDDPDAAFLYRAECAPLWRQQRASQAAERAAATRARARDGFAWAGGAIGGNPAYQTPPFHYKGLVSDTHPILKCFVTKLRRGRHLISGSAKDLVGPAPYGSKLLGCDDPYIEGSKQMRGFVRVEVDRILTWADIEQACQAANVPPPNIVVGWQDPEEAVRNPHLIWLLHDSVAFTKHGKASFKFLFQGVLRGLTAALQPYGADPGGTWNAMRV
jgi:hypothetical protein